MSFFTYDISKVETEKLIFKLQKMQSVTSDRGEGVVCVHCVIQIATIKVIEVKLQFNKF